MLRRREEELSAGIRGYIPCVLVCLSPGWLDTPVNHNNPAPRSQPTYGSLSVQSQLSESDVTYYVTYSAVVAGATHLVCVTRDNVWVGDRGSAD